MEDDNYKYVDDVGCFENIGGMLRRLRTRKNMTAYSIADGEKGICASSIYGFESGRVRMSHKNIARVFDKMGYRLVVFAVRKGEGEEG